MSATEQTKEYQSCRTFDETVTIMKKSFTMQTELLKVTGMTCGGCTSKVSNALKAVPGVSDVSVTFSAGVAKVYYDENITSSVQLKAAVISAGYGVDAANADQSGEGCCS